MHVKCPSLRDFVAMNIALATIKEMSYERQQERNEREIYILSEQKQ